MIFQPQNIRQRFRAAILQLGKRLAHQFPHGFGRNAAQRAIDRQNAPFLYPDGARHANAALLIPVYATIEGQFGFGCNLILQPGLIKPDHRDAARFIAKPQGNGIHALKAAEPGGGLGVAANADFRPGHGFFQRGQGGGILIANRKGEQKIGHRMDARLIQRFQTRLAQAFEFA